MIIVGEVKRTSGIYLITNLINGKVYVGSSLTLRKRMDHHNTQLNNNKHGNRHLQNAWNKYGGDNFSFSVIELVDEKDKLIEREQDWIDFYNSCDGNIGYNINPMAGSPTGRKMSNNEREKRRLNQKTKSFFQFDLEGNFIKEWHSIGEIHREFGISRSTISTLLKTKGKFKNSYYLISKDEFTEELLNECVNKKGNRKGRKIPSLYKKINQYDVENNFMQEWDSITIASKSLNIPMSTISNCCGGRAKSAGGFIWSYAD